MIEKYPEFDELVAFEKNFEALKESLAEWKMKKEKEIKNIEKTVQNSAAEIIAGELEDFSSQNAEKIKEMEKEIKVLVNNVANEYFEKFDIKINEFINKQKKTIEKKIEEFIEESKDKFSFIDEMQNKVKLVSGQFEEIETKFSSFRRDYVLFNEQITNGFENGLLPQSIIERISILEERTKHISNNK